MLPAEESEKKRMENRENCKGKRKAPKWRLQLKVQQIKFPQPPMESAYSRKTVCSIEVRT